MFWIINIFVLVCFKTVKYLTLSFVPWRLQTVGPYLSRYEQYKLCSYFLKPSSQAEEIQDSRELLRSPYKTPARQSEAPSDPKAGGTITKQRPQKYGGRKAGTNTRKLTKQPRPRLAPFPANRYKVGIDI